VKQKLASVVGGICKGIAEAFARHGASVVIIGRKQDKLDAAAKEISQLGPCLGVAADVRNFEQVKAAVDAAVKAFGKIDILVNGAAGNFLAPLRKLSPNAFKTVIDIDLIGTFNTTKACYEHLVASKGCVLNISATLHYKGNPFQGHPAAAKAGVDALTRVMATEWGPLGIRANVIAPGPIAATEGMKRLMPKGFDEIAPRLVPLQRHGSVRDIEYMALFLASDAGAWATGQIFVIDGGEWLTSGGFGYPDMLSML